MFLIISTHLYDSTLESVVSPLDRLRAAAVIAP